MPCLESGRIRINLRHTREDAEGAHTQLHRLFSGVPSVDIRPPDPVDVLGLHSVQLCLDLRSIEQNLGQMVEPGEVHQTKDDNINEWTETKSKGITENPISLEFVLEKPTQGIRKRKRSAHLSRKQNTGADSKQFPHTIDIDELGIFIDSALRVSVCEQTPKLPSGAKVMVKNFTASLAELCPSVWSPGYLSVSPYHPKPLLFPAEFIRLEFFAKISTDTNHQPFND